MIRIENLTKYYGDVKAVQSISFSLNDGEVVGFLGANGAGKSTTLKMMTGYLTPTSGNVYVNDQNIIDDCIDIQKQIGYLPELNPLYFEMKVHEYLKFHAEIRGIKDSDFNDALKKVVKECGLQGVVHRTVGNCSKGYKQRIGLAAAMIHNPKILILDEPVTGLDPNQIVEIRKLIKELGKQKTVILSSHILSEVEATCDRILIINRGRIVADGTSETLRSQADGQELLTVHIEAENEVLQKSLLGLGSVEKVITIDSKPGFYSIQSKPNMESRKAIFDLCVEKKWYLLEMTGIETRLEDVFRDLTN